VAGDLELEQIVPAVVADERIWSSTTDRMQLENRTPVRQEAGHDRRVRGVTLCT
jgi:hypothetical protein